MNGSQSPAPGKGLGSGEPFLTELSGHTGLDPGRQSPGDRFQAATLHRPTRVQLQSLTTGRHTSRRRFRKVWLRHLCGTDPTHRKPTAQVARPEPSDTSLRSSPIYMGYFNSQLHPVSGLAESALPGLASAPHPGATDLTAHKPHLREVGLPYVTNLCPPTPGLNSKISVEL